MRALWLVWAVGCTGVGTTKDDSAGGGGACDLVAESVGCPSCYEGPYTCAFDGVWAATGSCGDCVARQALYQELCDAGHAASAAEIEAGTTCAPTECAVTYACSCTPSCSVVVPASGATTETAADAAPCSTCPTPEDPPGPCAWDGATCSFPE